MGVSDEERRIIKAHLKAINANHQYEQDPKLPVYVRGLQDNLNVQYAEWEKTKGSEGNFWQWMHHNYSDNQVTYLNTSFQPINLNQIQALNLPYSKAAVLEKAAFFVGIGKNPCFSWLPESDKLELKQYGEALKRVVINMQHPFKQALSDQKKEVGDDEQNNQTPHV